MATSDVDNGSPRDWSSTGLEVDDPWDLEEGQRFGGHKSEYAIKVWYSNTF